MYLPSDKRYDKMIYSRCGRSGLKLPKVSMGLWQNFGHQGRFSDMEEMVHTAFDLGITHFDLANNYGNPYNGSAEENFGRILDRGMREFRDELCISTKAGYEMWDGPYGDRNGSRKYLIASLDQSLRRMKLDYVDIFIIMFLTRILRLRRRHMRWIRLFARAKHCMWESRIIMQSRPRECSNCLRN